MSKDYVVTFATKDNGLKEPFHTVVSALSPKSAFIKAVKQAKKEGYILPDAV